MDILYYLKRIIYWRKPRKLGKLAYLHGIDRELNPYSKNDSALDWWGWDDSYSTEELQYLLKSCLNVMDAK